MEERIENINFEGLVSHHLPIDQSVICQLQSCCGVNALKGQQAHSPGQSEATPWVMGTQRKERPERAAST